MSANDSEWVHDLSAGKRRNGDVLGWQDKRSETGWCSGIIVEQDFLHLRTRVTDIRAGTFA